MYAAGSGQVRAQREQGPRPGNQGAGPAPPPAARLERPARRPAVPGRRRHPGGERRVKRKSIARPLTYSVIFIAITATVTAILGISIAHIGVPATVGYRAVFSDVTGL